MHYSEPRLTLDIDIPLFFSPKDIPTILKCFLNLAATAHPPM
jgi:hypothetical protein